MSAASPAEWAQMLSLAVALHASASVPYFLLVEAEYFAWPRPVTAAVDRVHGSMKSGRLMPVWQPVVHAGHDVNRAIGCGHRAAREARQRSALTVAALLMLLTSNAPEATR